jgi:hypothetical protein
MLVGLSGGCEAAVNSQLRPKKAEIVPDFDS